MINSTQYAEFVLYKLCPTCSSRATGETAHRGILIPKNLCKECITKWTNLNNHGKIDTVPLVGKVLIN